MTRRTRQPSTSARSGARAFARRIGHQGPHGHASAFLGRFPRARLNPTCPWCSAQLSDPAAHAKHVKACERRVRQGQASMFGQQRLFDNPGVGGIVPLAGLAIVAFFAVKLGPGVVHDVQGLLHGTMSRATAQPPPPAAGNTAATASPVAATATAAGYDVGLDANGNYPWSVPPTRNGALASLPTWVGRHWKCSHKNVDGTWSPPRSIAELESWGRSRTYLTNCNPMTDDHCQANGWRLDPCAYRFDDDCNVSSPGC